jgi:hypothetical protein
VDKKAAELKATEPTNLRVPERVAR